MATEKQFQQYAFEIWGGIECTLNRVRNHFFDQLELTGHYYRADDIERICSLGVKAMRYPVLWEAHEINENEDVNWTWVERNLCQLRDNGVRPIAGLVHHGSGPAFTSLDDPEFPEKLARYARKVAEKFPWIEYYTPVNEPLTTARFSGLYGFWYPHEQDDRAFLRMLLNQVKGIILSMREIRKINPKAKLVQTEDLGKTYSDTVLKYQADFENERRWLAYDLLLGKVDKNHGLWKYLLWAGITEKELLFFRENACVPDICGFNYYVTSERYLDSNIEQYPSHLHGGNHRHRYVDTEAVRVRESGHGGLTVLLQEAWNRLRLPLAITEVFLSCTPDEQVRWAYQVCETAADAKENGIDLRAVTFWALLGESGWNTLVTSLDGEYESGAFDVRSGTPAETLIAEYIRSITGNGSFASDILQEHGWWQSENRFHSQDVCIEK